MTDPIFDTDTKSALTIEGLVPADEVPTLSKWFRLRQEGTVLVKYLLDSEVHTFAFSVAANAILSFIPFIVLLYALTNVYFHWTLMGSVISDMVNLFFPTNTTEPNFIAVSLSKVAPHHKIQIFSLIMILISCTGIFLPLEVALNQAWGVKVSRNYIMNQIVAFGLAIMMVVVAMLTILINAFERQLMTWVLFYHTENWFFKGVNGVWLTLSSGLASIVCFFAIYLLLPNCKVPWRSVLKTSVVTGCIWLVAKYIFVFVLPHLDLPSIYGPFSVSVGLIFWAYVSGLILFAGAQFSVNRGAAERISRVAEAAE